LPEKEKDMNIYNILKERTNIYELSYDCGLLLFPVLLERIYNPLSCVSISGIPFIQIFMLAAVYFLPLLTGRLYRNVFSHSVPVVKKTVIAILFTVTVFAYGNLIYLVMMEGGEFTTRGMFIFLAGTVLLIMGPIAGLAFQERAAEQTGDSPVQIILFLFTIGLLPLFYFFLTAKEIFGDINDILLFLAVCLFCVLDVILIMGLVAVFLALKRLLMRTGIYNSVLSVCRLLIPFFIAFIMVFFNIYADKLFTEPGRVSGTGSMIMLIAMYTFTGVLPLRIIMMIDPPVKTLNVMMGILTASLMVYFVSVN